MTVRRRGASRRRYEVTLKLLCVLANMRCSTESAAIWEEHWGGPDEGRAAFDELRHRRHHTLGSTLGVEDGESYEQWLERLASEAAEERGGGMVEGR